MWVEMSVFGLGFWLVYDHASRWKLRNTEVYDLHEQVVFEYADVACGVKSSKDVAKIFSACKIVKLELFFQG